MSALLDESRCQRICGGREGCFVLNDEQLKCISDVVMNTLTVMMFLVELALKENDYVKRMELITIANNHLEEVRAWINEDIKYPEELCEPGQNIHC